MMYSFTNGSTGEGEAEGWTPSLEPEWIGVEFKRELEYEAELLSELNRRSARFYFVSGRNSGGKRLLVTDSQHQALFRIHPGRHVAVSLWQAEEICAYAGMRVLDYLVVCSLMGLMQNRALELNPTLRPEDFLHESQDACLYGTLEHKSMAALRFERPYLCPGCLQFYACIGLESEALTLMSVLGTLVPAG